jgi:hypothetical protein
VLDPFTGSGSTGKAALLDGFKFVGVELTAEYLPIIEGRLRWAMEQEGETDGQMRLRRDHEHYSAKYWELKDAIEKHNDGLLREALTDYYFALIEAREALPETRTRDTRVKLAPKPKQKLIKAGKYQFTEQQLEIAARAFRKQGR